MKTKLLLTVLTCLLVFTSNASARRYGAIAYSSGEGSFGVTGLAWNWGTSSAAVSRAIGKARDINGGYLNGYRSYWWNHRGYNAAARGYSEDGSYVKFGWSYGWRTSSGAVNAALNKVYYYPYQRQYIYGYNP
jgi:hypothetical protein